jgi:hypothetical protein
MYQAAWKIGSDFWRSESDVKISFRGCAGFKNYASSFTLVKFCRFAFLRPAFGSRQKAGKKQLKNTQKAPKTEHKNVGLYAQKTAHSAY